MQNTDTLKVEIVKELTVEQLWDAVFGCDGTGIVYWSPKIRKQNGHGIDLWVMKDGEIKANPQNFKVWDIYENKWHFLSVEDLRKGYEKALTAGQTHCGNYPLDHEDYDACFADIVIQYGIFGDLVYG